MKILTANFITCAVKACKASPAAFPLHFRDAELEQTEMEYNPLFLRNILPRLEWDALKTTAMELGFTSLPEQKPDLPPTTTTTTTTGGKGEQEEADDDDDDEMQDAQEQPAANTEDNDALLRSLHKILIETAVIQGKMLCGNCGHEYKIKEGIANFLLPNHLV